MQSTIMMTVSILQRGSYLSGGFAVSYQRKPAAPGFEGKPPLLLVHPLGVGLSSWFWDPFLSEWSGSEVFVPDLIGCGASEAWQPSERGLFVPLDWVRALEALWREEIRRPVVVLAQGGLAPLAVQLATRETETWRGPRAVRGIVLASPPPWAEAADGLPEAEVRRNFELLSATLGSASPLGTLGYRALCARPFVRFFSRRFLFAAAAGADDDASADESLNRFVDACCAEAAPERRWPVLAFNAGLVGQRGLGDELSSLRTPTLVLAGAADDLWPLSDDGAAYESRMPNCRAVRLAGRNALPWESARETAEAVGEFVDGVAGVGLSWG